MLEFQSRSGKDLPSHQWIKRKFPFPLRFALKINYKNQKTAFVQAQIMKQKAASCMHSWRIVSAEVSWELLSGRKMKWPLRQQKTAALDSSTQQRFV